MADNPNGLWRVVRVPPHVQDVFETNVFGAIALTQKFLPLIRKDSGRILMISSLFGVVATPLWGTLAASKHAMEGAAPLLITVGACLHSQLNPNSAWRCLGHGSVHPGPAA